MNPEVLLRFFDQPIAFHRCLVPIAGGVNAALLLGQLIYWTPRAASREGWVYKTALELEGEIGLGRREQETARRDLRSRCLIAEKKNGIPPKIYFRVDVGALQMALEKAFGAETTRQPAQASNLAESAKLISPKAPNQFGAPRQINTETTGIDSSSSPREISPAGSPVRNAFSFGPAGVHMWTPADRVATDRLIETFGFDAVAAAVESLEQLNKEPLPGRVRRKLEQLARAQRAATKRTRAAASTPKAHLDVDPVAQATGEALLAKIRKKQTNNQGATP